MRPSVQEMIAQSNGKKKKKIIEKVIPIILFLIASVSVLTSIGIVLTLIVETITFFRRVPFFEFIFGTTWLPFSNKEAQFGILPLIIGTLKVTLIAVIVAVPIGIAANVCGIDANILAEQAQDGLHVAAHRCRAVRGQLDQPGPLVERVGDPPGQAAPFQFVHLAGDVRADDLHAFGDLADA